MFNYGVPNYSNPTYTYSSTPAAYPQRPVYQQPIYQQQPPMMQDGSMQARLVSGREEAKAATVIPGTIFLFYDRANGMVYSKLIDPQTGMPEFREYADTAPAAQTAPPQYVTLEMFDQFQQGLERRFEALQPNQKMSRKAANADD